MAQIQDSGSNYSFYDKKIFNNVDRSVFDLSYLNTLTANEGQLIPVWIQHTLPNEDYEISLQSLIRVVNPPVVPLMSRQRVFFHTYWSPYSSLWKYWQVFMSKGVSGNKSYTIPRISFSADSMVRGSLIDYLGYPTGTQDKNYVNALPLMMYLRVYRDYYKNPNLDVDNEFFYPDNDEDFVLSFTGDKDFGATGTFLDEISESFATLLYRDFVDDYFTSGRPFPMRGSVPTIDFRAEASQAVPASFPVGIDSNGAFVPLNASLIKSTSGNAFGSTVDSSNNLFYGYRDNDVPNANVLSAGLSAASGTMPSGGFESLRNYSLTANGTLDFSNVFFTSQLTAESIRQLFTQTVIMEKMARTNGMYGEFVETFFGSSPRNALNFRPYYVGGTFAPLVFSEVLQTSEDGSTPLGTVGGKGISADSGFIGKFHTDDFGLFMTVMSIMPDVYYSQGVQRENLYQVQEDFFLPERAELGMQAVFNGEIFYTGNDDEDYGLFNYQDRFDELRYRSNEIHGLVADQENESFNPYIQSRYFPERPVFNREFVSTKDNISKKWLTAPSEVPYVVQISNRIKAVRPVPYRAVPAGLVG